jgi:uracil-DNA glycosylase
MIDKSWQPLFDQYDFDLDDIYTGEVYPPREQVFRVFEMPVHKIRIVLLGQDPYHGPGQAHGLSFSVPTGIPIPPSLLNIYKELKRCFPDRKYEFPSGNLEEWFYREKIFLCNTSLTVERGKAGSHMEIWKDFTDEVIQFIDKHNPSCVFLLLGNFAKSKSSLITKKNRIVTEVHPSPLARGFVGSGVFERVEKVLGSPVNWSIEEEDLSDKLSRMNLGSPKKRTEKKMDEDIDETLCNKLQSLTLDPTKKVIYLDCDPAVCGQSKIAVTLDYSEPKPIESKPKPKRTRLQQMCEEPQTIGEEAVKIYVEYSKEKNLPIKVEDINDILTSM